MYLYLYVYVRVETVRQDIDRSRPASLSASPGSICYQAVQTDEPLAPPSPLFSVSHSLPCRLVPLLAMLPVRLCPDNSPPVLPPAQGLVM